MNNGEHKRDFSTLEKMELGIAICNLFQQGTKTIDGCCQSKNVQLLEFYQWTKQLPELKEYYRRSKDLNDGRFNAKAKTLARKKLLQILEGYTVTKYELEIKGQPKQSVNTWSELKDLLSKQVEGVEITMAMIQTTKQPSDAFLLAILRNVNDWQ